MSAASQNIHPETSQALQAAAEAARRSGAFRKVDVGDRVIECRSSESGADASYRIAFEDGAFYVAWVSPDRYLSQSIEADLMWTGDDLDDLIDEELAAQGWSGDPLGEAEHFRSEEKLFTFRSRIPLDPAQTEPARDGEELARCLLAYEAAFRELGDMKPADDE